MPDILLRDVTLRDGLQNEPPIDTADKLAIFDALLAAGVVDLEVASFVRPDLVPSMADAEEICAATAGVLGADGGDIVRWGLVLNERGAQRAIEAGLVNLQFVVSASDAHSRNNAGRSTDAAMEALAAICALAGDNAVVETTISTAFGCPFQGPVDPERVVALAQQATASGSTAINLADTIGTAIPRDVTNLVGSVTEKITTNVGAHLHDTRGLGVANALAALDAGAIRLDAAVGGLGGCPFAPGASGNVALEDVAHALEESGIETGLSVPRLMDAADAACTSVERPIASHVGVAGPRFHQTHSANGG